jgi:hypothetical protein
MKTIRYAALAGCLTLLMSNFSAKCQSQQSKISVLVADGIAVAGYTDNGAYLNFTGPGVKFSRKPFLLVAGLLPTLKIKEDKVAPGATQNSMVTPTLGFGLTAAYKHFAVQVPFYYTGKTAAADGKWKTGVGVGYRF